MVFDNSEKATNLREHCKIIIDRFKTRVLPLEWSTRSILTSEAFGFCTMASLMKADLIVESGIYDGRSLEVWRRFADNDEAVMGFDGTLRPAAVKMFAKTGVRIYEQDTKGFLPTFIATSLFDYDRVAVFIDGPKNHAAIDLGKLCLALPNVCMVAIHDLHQGPPNNRRGSRVLMDKWRRTKWYTDAKWFVDAYGHLDTDESHLDPVQNMKWMPYKMIGVSGETIRDYGPSYGPTIGFATKEAIKIT